MNRSENYGNIFWYDHHHILLEDIDAKLWQILWSLNERKLQLWSRTY